MNQKKIEELVKSLLTEIGEDYNREGLIRTPHRVAKAYDTLTSGYKINIDEWITDFYGQRQFCTPSCPQ